MATGITSTPRTADSSPIPRPAYDARSAPIPTSNAAPKASPAPAPVFKMAAPAFSDIAKSANDVSYLHGKGFAHRLELQFLLCSLLILLACMARSVRRMR
jgi:hypothetical protein